MILGSHRFCCIDDMGFSTRHQRHYTGRNSKPRINQSNLINQNIFSAKDVSTGQKQHVSKIDEIIWPNQHQVPAVFIFDFISNISGEAKQTRRKLFPAMRSKQDANHFRRSEASKMQIISGEAKQARRTCFPAKRRKRDASYFRRSKASETHINYDDAKQARRKIFPAKRSKLGVNHFRQSEASETHIISGEAKHARRKSFPAKRSKRDASYFRRSKASETHINYDDAKQARRKYFRRSEASETQIISGDVKQARRTQIISGEAKQARRKSFLVKQNKQDANYFNWFPQVGGLARPTDFHLVQTSGLVLLQYRPCRDACCRQAYEKHPLFF